MKELEFVAYSLVWGREKYEQNEPGDHDLREHPPHFHLN